MLKIVKKTILSAFGVAGIALVCAACATSGGKKRNLNYAQTAHENYKKGVAELEDDDYEEAVRYFTFVKNKFPFSRYSTLSELRMADSLFKQEKYAEAADAYKLFMNFHPTHKQVVNGYAAFRVCLAAIKQLPDDWVLIPPSREKDQSATKEAMTELASFLRVYKGSTYEKRAQKLYRQCVKRLVSHELYVARFYLDRDKPKAAMLRLEGVLARFPDMGVDPESMLLLGRVYLKLHKWNNAKQILAQLIAKYPNDASSEKAKLYLKHLNDN